MASVSSSPKVTWPRTDVLTSCQSYGQLVDPLPGIDGARLLAAMAMNESALGDNCGPRHEPAYDVGGLYASDPAQKVLLSQYPYWGASSFGPLQVMLVNLPGATPQELNGDLSLVFRLSVGFLNQQIRRFSPASLQDIGEIWNGGHKGAWNADIEQYCKSLESNYEQAEVWLRSL